MGLLEFLLIIAILCIIFGGVVWHPLVFLLLIVVCFVFLADRRRVR